MNNVSSLRRFIQKMKGNITDNYIDSRFLQEKINMKIYLPENYSPLYTYQLLIALDGDDYLQKGKLPTLASELIENKEMEQTIIVMLPYHSVEDRYEKYHPNGTKNKQFIRFLAEELVPFIEESYKTYELPSARTLLGDSLAATVSLHSAFEYPYTFGQVIAQSPYINATTMEKLQSIRHYEMLRLYHVIGKKETSVETTKGNTKDFLTPNRAFYELCEQKGIDVFYDEFNGEHTWLYWQQDLKRALSRMLS